MAGKFLWAYGDIRVSQLGFSSLVLSLGSLDVLLLCMVFLLGCCNLQCYLT